MLITHSFFTETVSLETGQLNTALEVLEYQKTTAKEPAGMSGPQGSHLR